MDGEHLPGEDRLRTVLCEIFFVVAVGRVEHGGKLLNGEAVDYDSIGFLRKMTVIFLMAALMRVFSMFLMNVVVWMFLMLEVEIG